MKIYYLTYECRNCFAAYWVAIPYGQEAQGGVKCPNCGRNACNPKRKPDDLGAPGWKIENKQLVEA